MNAWAAVRSPGFDAEAHRIIAETVPTGVELKPIAHLRSAHYAAYRVGAAWVVRIGAAAATDDDAPANTGFLGTAAASPTGQHREFEIARDLAAGGAPVIAPRAYARCGSFDVLWIPFIHGTPAPVSARVWHRALSGLHAVRPGTELPVFTNRAKTFARLDDLPEAVAGGLRNRYDTALEDLFEEATAWSVVHGDAHAGNVINTGTRALLFDLDTVCWAPSVWDLTHLLNRAGTAGNTGYTAAELAGLFPFTAAEVSAALELRRVAALIAREHRNRPAPIPALIRAAA